jgi:hypothetical protein
MDRIDRLDGFFTRQYALYLHEHRHPLNRATHMVGVPLLLVTLIAGLALHNWRLLVAGQVAGWTIQLIGHRIEGNRPAVLKNLWSMPMGILMVLLELIALCGLRFRFAEVARSAVS